MLCVACDPSPLEGVKFHPVKGELRPAEFIPVAEETGVIVTLGNWITRQAALACAQWPEDVSVAVNLSPLQIKAPGAVLAIESALREAQDASLATVLNLSAAFQALAHETGDHAEAVSAFLDRRTPSITGN